MATYDLRPNSLKPPALSDDDYAAAEENLPWVLLELDAYIAKVDNATTAFSKTWDGRQIQVTFFPRRPPRLSYLCVYISGDVELHWEPDILAVEDDLAVLRIIVGRQEENMDYYVYQADGGSGKPSLTHLPRPPNRCFFDASDMGILPYSTADQSGNTTKEYIVAGFVTPLDKPLGWFVLYLYDSKRADWKTYTVSLSQQEEQQHGVELYHKNRKVMAIGGDVGTMAFVDLWRGVLFCDLLQVEREAERTVEREAIPLLRYVSLPDPLLKNTELRGDARLYRNIAVVKDCLKYVELQPLQSRGQRMGGWMASIWSRPATATSSSGSWSQDCKISNSKELEDDDDNHQYFWLLPRPYEGMYLPSFMFLDTFQPVLGLQDEADILCFTTKMDRMDDDARVVAVDMTNKKLLGVASFAVRYVSINFVYVHSRISQHLKNNAPGTQMVLPGSSSKMKDEMVAGDGDAMAFD